MPRPRQKALFELGGQWIGRESGKPFLYRFWHDAGTGHSRRASLGTENLEAAKAALAEIVVKGAPKDSDSYLSVILETYYQARTDHLPSAYQARRAGTLALECWGDLIRAGGIDEERQKKFVRDGLKAKQAISYISRNLGVIAAAIEHAGLNIRITYGETAILNRWPEFEKSPALKPKAKRKIYEPTDEEMARLLRANISPAFRRWVLNSMATAGRPEAVLQLTPDSRVRDLGLIDLNPEGRRQNKKYRAAVRVIPSQKMWLDQWEAEDAAARKKKRNLAPEYVRYASVDSIDTVLQRYRDKEEINIPRLSAYSIRHRATSVMRADKVPGEQISYQLGHRRPREKGESRTTRNYGSFEADYLKDASAALERWVSKILKLAKAKPTVAKLQKAA